MPNATPSVAQLHRALAIAEQIQKLEEELAAILGNSPADHTGVAAASAPPAKTGRRGGKRVVSAETRAKMVASAKARYAKKNGASADGAEKPAKAEKKKRVLSPEGRARIVAALKARHAARKAAAH